MKLPELTLSDLMEVTVPKLSGAYERLERAGWRMFARGRYSTVWDKIGIAYVLKVYATYERGYVNFIDYVVTHPGEKYLPRLYGRPVVLNEVYSAVRLERLYWNETQAMKTINLLRKADWAVYENKLKKDSIPEEELPDVQAINQRYPGFIQLYLNLMKILLGTPESIRDDMHHRNIMFRKDETPVIIDPVAMFYAANRRLPTFKMKSPGYKFRQE